MKLLLLISMISLIKAQGLSVLNFSPSARSSASGNNGVSFTGSPAISMHYNPASLSEIESRYSLNFHYMKSQLAEGQNYVFLAGKFSLNKNDHFGLSIRYYSKGEQDFLSSTDEESTEQFSPYDYEFSLAYSRVITGQLSLGLKSSLIKSALAPSSVMVNSSPVQSPTILSLQISSYYKFENKLDSRLGFSLSNLGGRYQYLKGGVQESLPTTLQLGFRSNILESEYGLSTASVEYRNSIDEGIAIGLNLNQDIYDFAVMHLGYVIDNGFQRNRNYMTNGISLKKDDYRLSFSYQFMSSKNGQIDPFDGTWNLSFQMDLNPSEESNAAKELMVLSEYVESEKKVVEEQPKTEIIEKQAVINVLVPEKKKDTVQTKEIRSLAKKERLSSHYKSLMDEASSLQKEKGIKLISYEVNKNDNLWNLAEKYLGDPYRYKEIFGKNIGRIKNENLIEEGQEIIVIQKSDDPNLEMVFYQVNKGESLVEIAERLYNNESKWIDLYKWNSKILEKKPDLRLPKIFIKILIHEIE